MPRLIIVQDAKPRARSDSGELAQYAGTFKPAETRLEALWKVVEAGGKLEILHVGHQRMGGEVFNRLRHAMGPGVL